jgi:nicotinamide N-methyltransferase
LGWLKNKANTLLADHLFNPALVIAERLERRLIAPNGPMLELGAGAALPSLLSTLTYEGDGTSSRLVVITDYPDPGIMNNVDNNVRENTALFTSTDVRTIGHEWGSDPTPLR